MNKTNPINKLILLSAVILCSYSLSYAQISAGGTPPSFDVLSVGFNDNIPSQVLPSFDVERVRREADEEGGIYRMGQLIPVNYTTSNSGQWQTLANGDRIWRLKIEADNQAKGLNPYFDDFYLPTGARLFIYNELKEQVLGAFTSQNNPSNGSEFTIDHIRDNNFIIEYYEPAGTTEKLRLRISEIGYAFRGIVSLREARDFGDSGSCNINVNCSPVGDDWQDEKHGVARILVKLADGQYWCSGSLINNVRQDCTPYFLTALHCGVDGSMVTTAANFNQWIFYFDYEAAGCTNPAAEPTIQSVTGCTLRSYGDEADLARMGSDYLLVELNTPPPSSYNVYYNGWNANNVSTDQGTGIHHPSGDIMKISTFNTALVSDSWSNPNPITHWRVVWSTNANGWGITEPGSSGSPLFNTAGEIIGTLSAGGAACSAQSAPDIYGKTSYHWTSNGAAPLQQLKAWLDPDNTGALTMSGTYAPCPTCMDPITVTSTADSGPGSLREAVANLCPGGTIFIDVAAPIVLSTPIDITEPVVATQLSNAGSNPTIISGGGTVNLFNVTNNGYLSMFNINLTEGDPAVNINDGQLFTNRCNFYDNVVAGCGAAIRGTNAGIFLIESAMYDNSSTCGTAIKLTNSVSNRGFNLYNCTFVNNVANTGFGGALDLWFQNGAPGIQVNSSTFHDNSAAGSGQAIWLENPAYPMEMKNSIVYGNGSGGEVNMAGGGTAISSFGGNVFEEAPSGVGPDDIVGQDPAFGNLVNENNRNNKVLEIFPWGSAFDAGIDCNDIDGNALTASGNGVTRPANDACDSGAYEYRTITAACDALLPLTCGASVGDLSGTLLYLNCGVQNPAQMFEYTPQTTGNLNLSLHSFTDNLQLFLYDDVCGSACPVLAASTNAGNTAEMIDYIVTAGTTYYILVWGANNNESTYSLDAICPTLPLLCDNKLSISCDETVTNDLDTEYEFTEGCANWVLDPRGFQLYQFIPVISGTVVIDLFGFSDDKDLYVFTSPCDANCFVVADSEDIGTTSEQVTINVTAGIAYDILISDWTMSGGQFSLSITCTDPCEEDIVLVSPDDDIPGAAFIYATNKSIYATNKISGVSSVDYSAGIDAPEAIHLNEGFEVGLGAVFHAYFDGCGILAREASTGSDGSKVSKSKKN